MKINLELNAPDGPDGRIWLDFWDSDRGDDVIWELMPDGGLCDDSEIRIPVNLVIELRRLVAREHAKTQPVDSGE